MRTQSISCLIISKHDKPLLLEHSINLNAKVSDFIKNDYCYIPSSIILNVPNLVDLIHKITIPRIKGLDELVWIHLMDGDITFEGTFNFKDRMANLFLGLRTSDTDISPTKF
jgi:hypothetical protein